MFPDFLSIIYKYPFSDIVTISLPITIGLRSELISVIQLINPVAVSIFQLSS